MQELPGTRILHVEQPRIPELRFEWHPVTGVVYVCQKNTKVIQADAFAWTIWDSGAAWNAILIWCRGYIAHKIDFANLTSIDQREEGKSDGKPVFARSDAGKVLGANGSERSPQ